MPESKQDRELIELLNELRVALPGVQVLFAFLLAVPFTQRWLALTDGQRDAFFFCFISATVATVLLMTPTAFHRIQWRAHDKEAILRISNGLTIAGMAVLAVSMNAAVYLITDVVVGNKTAGIVTGASVALFALFWFVLPIGRHIKTEGLGSNSKKKS